MDTKKILMVGCGKMGGALLDGITTAGVLTKNILIVEPNPESIPHKFNVRILKKFEPNSLGDFLPDIIIFAVKPQIIESIIADYRIFAERSLFVSIIAGKTTYYFENHLGNNVALIRTMPNLPVAVGEGATVFYPNKNVTEEQLNFPLTVFAKIGIVRQIEDESLMDAVTAISGSGPAYVFYFIERNLELSSEPVDSKKFMNLTSYIKQSAVELGLNDEIASSLASQIIKGSLLLLKESGKTATELRKMVTSPGGTTEAALRILMECDMKSDNMKEFLLKATEAACKRSKELSE